jgi:hypothetical protein
LPYFFTAIIIFGFLLNISLFFEREKAILGNNPKMGYDTCNPTCFMVRLMLYAKQVLWSIHPKGKFQLFM